MMKSCREQQFQQVSKRIHSICLVFRQSFIETSSRETSALTVHSSVSSVEHRPSPLIKLYVKPYRGKRILDGNGIYSVSTTTKVNHRLFAIDIF